MSYPISRRIIYLYGKAVRIALHTALRNVGLVSGLENDVSNLKPAFCLRSVRQGKWHHVGVLCARTFGLTFSHCVPEHLASHSRSVCQKIWPHIHALCARTFGLAFSHCVPEHLAPHSRSLCQNVRPFICALCARTFGLTFSHCVPEHLSDKEIL
jgi:hypothetical protein